MLSRWLGRGPSTYALHLTPTNERLMLRSDQSLLQAALDQGVAFPHSCRAGGCGACKCRLVQGRVKELTDKSYLLSAEEMRANTILACQSLPRSDLVVELPAQAARAAHASHTVVDTWATITALTPLAPGMLSVALRSDELLRYTAGQYARLGRPRAWASQEAAGRCYSFASAPGHGDAGHELSFIIRHVPGGAFTDWLFGAAGSGDRLPLQGPFGEFGLRPDSRPIVAACGGSGFAPIRAMLEQALAEGQARRDCVLFFGARQQADLYGQATLAEFERRWSGRFEVVPVLSHEPPGSGWRGRRGWIHEAMLSHLGGRLAVHQAYLCGPPALVEACVQTLTAAGVEPGHIHADKFLDQRHTAPARADRALAPT